MDDIRLTIADETVSALREAREKKDRVGPALTIFQITSIVAAGIWTLYTYITFQGESNALALRLAALQEQQSRGAIKLATLDTRKRAIEVARGEQTPVALSHELKAVRLHSLPHGRIRYLITYNYLITNVSDRPVNLDNVIINGFYASTGRLTSDSTEVNDFLQSSPVKWAGVFRHAHMLLGWKQGVALVDGDGPIPTDHGGGGTGTAKSGEALQGGVDLLLSAKPSDLIGFKVRLRLGETKELKDKRYLRIIGAIKSFEEPEAKRLH